MARLLLFVEPIKSRAFTRTVLAVTGCFQSVKRQPLLVHRSSVKHLLRVTSTCAPAPPLLQVRYVGSPYQTSLSEAGQEKRLLVLNRRLRWACVEEILLATGRCHFRTQSAEELDQLADRLRDSAGLPRAQSPQRGDRVVATLPFTQQEAPAVALLRERGVEVEVRDKAMDWVDPEAGGIAAELDEDLVDDHRGDLSPPEAFAQFVGTTGLPDPEQVSAGVAVHTGRGAAVEYWTDTVPPKALRCVSQQQPAPISVRAMSLGSLDLPSPPPPPICPPLLWVHM